jgi:DNA repair protein RecO (recombination protein O)
MLRLTAEPAFVLHRRQYSETSLLVELYTAGQGRVGVLAKGARGRQSTLPALLQPFQPLRIDAAGRGELLRLAAAEADGPAIALAGQAALAGLYVNELMVRLCPRGDPHPRLLGRYQSALCGIADPVALAWELRRFERDLLDELGYGGDYERDAAGARIEGGLRYRLQPQSGFVGIAEGEDGISGSALLALALDQSPPAAELKELRKLLRQLIAGHLEGEPLKSWALWSGLPR